MAAFIESVELTDKDENGFQRVILWHESGGALATLNVEHWANGLDGAGKEAVMCDLLDVLQDGLAANTEN